MLSRACHQTKHSPVRRLKQQGSSWSPHVPSPINRGNFDTSRPANGPQPTTTLQTIIQQARFTRLAAKEKYLKFLPALFDEQFSLYFRNLVGNVESSCKGSHPVFSASTWLQLKHKGKQRHRLGNHTANNIGIELRNGTFKCAEQ